MPIIIAGKADVFKFALSLYDYLIHKGHKEAADLLSQLVDSCFPNDTLALKAHLDAFAQIKQNITDLPPLYQQALEDAMDYIKGPIKDGEYRHTHGDFEERCDCRAYNCRDHSGKVFEDEKASNQEFKEIELKLKLQDPKQAEKILQDPLLLKLSGNSQPQVKEYETTYFDTEDYLFLKHQVCYRIRKGAGEYIGTIKGFGSSQKGLSIRNEWSRSLSENRPSLEPFRDLAIGQKMMEILKDKECHPIFVTRFKRTTLDLICEDESQIELAFDLGEIVAADRKEPICELELELKKGSLENVLNIGESLSKVYDLKPEEKSKYQRGMLLAGKLFKQT